MSDEKKEQEVQHVEVTAVEPTALAIMERAEIDSQISTAKQFPRSLATFIKQAKDMVTVDEETAESCIYRRPVGREGNQVVYAEGESIRLAEMVAACYGNLRVSSIITEMNPRFVKAVGFAHDLEKNYAAKSEVVESTVTRQGVPFSERMRIVVAKAAQSKAMRDAIFRVVPKSLCKSVTKLAREVAFGKTQMPLDKRREGLLQWITKIGIEQDRLFAALGVAGIEEIGIEHLEILTGLKTAIKDGDITADEAFPQLTKAADAIGKGVSALEEKIAKRKPGRPKKDEPTQPEQPEAQQPQQAPTTEDLRMKWVCDGCGMFLPEKSKCPTCETDKDVRQATKKDYVDLNYGS